VGPVTIYEVAAFVNKALQKAATPENNLAGFEFTGILFINRNAVLN